MKISTMVSYTRGFVDATGEIAIMEKAGLDLVWIPGGEDRTHPDRIRDF
jgi:hypothetical protein